MFMACSPTEDWKQAAVDARRIARAPRMEAALLAAEELADAAARGECPWRDGTSEHREWHKVTASALAAYRKAMEGE